MKRLLMVSTLLVLMVGCYNTKFLETQYNRLIDIRFLAYTIKENCGNDIKPQLKELRSKVTYEQMFDKSLPYRKDLEKSVDILSSLVDELVARDTMSAEYCKQKLSIIDTAVYDIASAAGVRL